jgi:hypothetical protein
MVPFMRTAASLILALPLAAQDGFAWLRPGPGPDLATAWSAERAWMADADGGALGRSEARAVVGGAAWRGESSEVALGARLGRTWLEGDPVLPDGRGLPRTLDEVAADAVARRWWNDGTVVGLRLAGQSLADRPLADRDEVGLHATAFARLPASPTQAWLTFVDWSEDRAILPGIPIPGAAWQWQPRRGVNLLLGVPISFASWRTDPRWGAEAFFSGLGAARVGADASPLAAARWLRTDLGWSWRTQTWRRQDRLDERDRIQWREMRVELGVGFSAGPQRRVRLAAGWAFARWLGEGRGQHAADNAVRLDPGPVAGASAAWAW